MGFGLDIPSPADILFGQELSSGGLKSPPFIIEELTGQRRSVTLKERALPYRPVAWTSRMRTKLTWYPGSANATQQVLGPEEAPTTVEGMWKDRFIQGAVLVNGDPLQIRSAEQCARLFYDLCKSGNVLRVVWGTEVRIGVLKEFSANWDRFQDLSWHCEFEWSGRDDSVRERAVKTPLQNPLDKMNALDDLLAFGPLDVVTRFQASLIDVVDQLRDQVGQLFDYVRAINALKSSPQTLLGALAAVVNSIRLETTEEIARLTETPTWGVDKETLDALTAKGVSGSPSATARVAALLSNERFGKEVARSMAALRSSCIDTLRDQEERAVPPEIALITMPEDTSLYALSSRFYGTPDLADFLARANGIKGTLVVPAGSQLRIPPRPAPGAEGGACAHDTGEPSGPLDR
jgi:hypothetical protein